MQVSVTKDELYSVIKKAVKDVIHEERIEFILQSAPLVSTKSISIRLPESLLQRLKTIANKKDIPY